MRLTHSGADSDEKPTESYTLDVYNDPQNDFSHKIGYGSDGAFINFKYIRVWKNVKNLDDIMKHDFEAQLPGKLSKNLHLDLKESEMT